MGKKFKILLVFISISLTLCLMSNTYSRYVADATGNLDVLFAKWKLLVNSTDITNNTNSSITLVPTMLNNDNVKSNTIAPSSKGYFDVIIDPTNVDISFNYNITLDLNNSTMPDLVITKYALIDSDTTTETYNTLSSNSITGTFSYDNNTANFKYSPLTVRIYFEWIEGTKDEKMNDEADTAVGTNAATNNTSFKVNATISFEQVVNSKVTEIVESTETSSVADNTSLITEN